MSKFRTALIGRDGWDLFHEMWHRNCPDEPESMMPNCFMFSKWTLGLIESRVIFEKYNKITNDYIDGGAMLLSKAPWKSMMEQLGIEDDTVQVILICKDIPSKEVLDSYPKES
jgi:hypothetical protein